MQRTENGLADVVRNPPQPFVATYTARDEMRDPRLVDDDQRGNATPYRTAPDFYGIRIIAKSHRQQRLQHLINLIAVSELKFAADRRGTRHFPAEDLSRIYTGL